MNGHVQDTARLPLSADSNQTMNQYPPGEYVSLAMKGLPGPRPDSVLQRVEIDAGRWGRYRITFIAVQNPRRGMRNWFWTMHAGERLELGK